MKSFDAHRLSPSVKLALLQLRCAGLLLSLLAFFPGMAFAQAPTWPAKPIKILVPFAPGGNTDSIARIIAERLTQTLGQSVLVENKVGAGGGPAQAAVAAVAALVGIGACAGAPHRAHVQQVRKEIGAQHAHPLGEHAVTAATTVGPQHP